MNLDSDLIQSSLLQLGWSDRELSRRADIGYNRLIEVIWNLTDDTTQMEAHRIADALKIPYSDIMVDEETPYRERFRNMKPLDRFALKKLMTAKKVEQKALAHNSRVPQSTISNLLSGKKKATTGTLLKLAWALDVPPERLMQAKRPAKKQAGGSSPPK